MRFIIAAMNNTSFLCGGIVVSAVIAMLSDMSSETITLHLWDIADLVLVLLVVMYLRVAEHSESREFIKAMLCGVVTLLVAMYTVGL